MPDISRLELRHLRYFVAVAVGLHFGRAAETLHMAQPPLSQAIQQLEAIVGVRLLERTRRRVALTDSGAVFLEEARRTLRAAEQAVGAARQAGRGQLGRLEIGFVGSAPFNVLPGILRTFREEYPGVSLALHELATAAQAQALLERRIDVGFVRPPLEVAGIVLEGILREPLVAALPEGHRLARRARVPIAALAGEPFIIFPRRVAQGLYDQITGLCRKAGFEPDVAQEAPQMQTIVGLVGAGLGIALVPESVQIIHGTGVVYRPLRPAGPPVELAVARRRGDEAAVVRNFMQVVRDLTPR